MAYMHIDNLYKAQQILAFQTCYALEKIHGTSANLGYEAGVLTFFSGGEPYDRFRALFDQDGLMKSFTERFGREHVVIYGEAYGGKQQGMRLTYGESLKFVAFDVKINNCWLDVPTAEALVVSLGLEFVDYSLIPTTLGAIDAERDKPSTQALRNGITEPKLREGVVLRPPYEVSDNRGNRIISKHKRAEFSERGRPQVDLDPTKRELLAGADAIAMEWVTHNRLEHVINQVLSGRDNKTIEMSDTPLVIKTMLEDILREASGEILDSKPARKAISTRTVQLFKLRFMEALSHA